MMPTPNAITAQYASDPLFYSVSHYLRILVPQLSHPNKVNREIGPPRRFFVGLFPSERPLPDTRPYPNATDGGAWHLGGSPTAFHDAPFAVTGGAR